MKIIIDDKIPYIEGALEPFAEVVYLPGSKTTPEIAKDADALVTRTRTICNSELLEGSNVKFIATATIPTINTRRLRFSRKCQAVAANIAGGNHHANHQPT